MCPSSLLPTIDEMLRCGMPSRAWGRSPAEGQVTTEIARPGSGPVISVPRPHLPGLSVTLVLRPWSPGLACPDCQSLGHTLTRDMNCSQ